MQLRWRRQTGSGTPTPHGDYLFAGDGNQFARIYYSGSPSPVSLPTAACSYGFSIHFFKLSLFMVLGVLLCTVALCTTLEVVMHTITMKGCLDRFAVTIMHAVFHNA